MLTRAAHADDGRRIGRVVRTGAEAQQVAAAIFVGDALGDLRIAIGLASKAGRRPDNQDFVLVNDHDPKPLYYHFKAEYDGAFTWDYLDQGPDVWRVRISRTA